jgi:hypothetical protein
MKNKQAKKEIVPEQKKGNQTGAKHTVDCISDKAAHELFKIGKQRLTDINHWADYCSVAIAETTLTDEKGNVITGLPKIGDYIRINLAGPGSRSGDGYDWVRIEEFIDQGNEDTDEELFGFRVRPTSNPISRDNNTSHFYTSDATSSFIVERKGNAVSASEVGKNEIPNVKTERIIDKVRNAMIATGGMVGLSMIQWKILMKGILETK